MSALCERFRNFQGGGAEPKPRAARCAAPTECHEAARPGGRALRASWSTEDRQPYGAAPTVETDRPHNQDRSLIRHGLRRDHLPPSGKALGEHVKTAPACGPGRSLTPEPGGASLFRGAGPLQPPSFPIAALAAICSASFLLRPCPLPTGVPFRSTSTKKRLSWSGPSSPTSW